MKYQFVVKGNIHTDTRQEAERAKAAMAEELINMGWDIESVEIVEGEGAESGL